MSLLKWSLIATVVLSASNLALACQLPQSYYKNVSCTSNSHYFLAVKDSGLPVALLNRNGNSVADLTPYTQVDTGKLQNGVMPVQRSGKVGYIDTQGREVVPIIYDMLADDAQTSGWARAANSNRIVVRKNGRFGVISTSNQVILPFSNQYRSISDFKNGVAEIQKTNGVSWIATNGRAVQNSNAPTPSSVTQSDPSSENTNPITNPSSIPQSALYQNEIWQPVKRDGKWGFVNSQNVPMIRFSFDEVTPFSEGLAGVRVNNNWGFVDLSGALVIPFRFDEDGVIRDETTLSAGSTPPFVFQQGKAWIGNLNDGTKLCIDTDGTNVPCDVSSSQPPVTLTDTSTETSTSSETLVVSTTQSSVTSANEITQQQSEAHDVINNVVINNDEQTELASTISTAYSTTVVRVNPIEEKEADSINESAQGSLTQLSSSEQPSSEQSSIEQLSTQTQVVQIPPVQTEITQNSTAQNIATEISADESSTTLVQTISVTPVKQVEPLQIAKPLEPLESIDADLATTSSVTIKPLNVIEITPDYIESLEDSSENTEEEDAIAIDTDLTDTDVSSSEQLTNTADTSELSVENLQSEETLSDTTTRTTIAVMSIKPAQVAKPAEEAKATDSSDANYSETDMIAVDVDNDNTTSNSTTETEPDSLFDSEPVDINQPVQQAPKPLNVIDTPAINVTMSTDTLNNEEVSELQNETQSELQTDPAETNPLATEPNNELELDESILLTDSENANDQNEYTSEQNDQNEFSNSTTTRIVSIKPVQSEEVVMPDVSEQNLNEQNLNQQSYVNDESLTIHETQSVIRTQDPN